MSLCAAAFAVGRSSMSELALAIVFRIASVNLRHKLTLITLASALAATIPGGVLLYHFSARQDLHHSNARPFTWLILPEPTRSATWVQP